MSGSEPIAISVKLGPRSYEILVGPGVLSRAGSELRKLGVGRRVALVSDPAVGARYGEGVAGSLREAGFEVQAITVPPGEAAKTIEVAQRGWDALASANLDRTSTVVALGGGTVGDLAGFVAATYMRGVNLVHVPTTLLAQVDASSGGKTAINHPRAKNLIGAFHQPRLVICDTAVLASLPARVYRSGLAEVIKHGIVLDAAYFRDLEGAVSPLRARDRDCLTRVIAGSCQIKASVVERDEQETDLRAVLNYGHTIGHALEAATDYGRWTHGEAVALGIAAASSVAERVGIARPGVRDQQVRLLEAVDLPTQGIDVPAHAVMAAIDRDKKGRDGRVPFVLAPSIGSFRLVFDVPRTAVLEALDELA
jgi:3-dehydroquinate synthase